MNIDQYLERIGYNGPLKADIHCLKRLHACHVMSIPFEALDIQWGRKIDLRLEAIFNKVVLQNRGGYCYEVNHLFHALLNKIGFDSHLISARVYSNDAYEPEFDHMAIVVNLEEQWLVDIGFGDLFIEPLKIQPDIDQVDYFKFYKIEKTSDQEYILHESLKEIIDYRISYRFSTHRRQISDFVEQNEYKQTSSDSHFVKNRICTIATKTGRKTIRNSTYKVRTGEEVKQREIENEEELNHILIHEFGIFH